MKKQALNPFLPLDTYIPDGEPHVFGNRIYLFGSHDTEGGTRYCAEEDYLCYSAPVTDLSDWRCDGVIFEAKQDPNYVDGAENDLYAPDVVQGNDGRFYLYYNMTGNVEKTGFHDLLHVAVCDTPAGRYEYYGFVKNPDGSPYRTYLDGDPAVLNDDGVIRLYHGWSLSMVAADAHRAGENQDQAQQPDPTDPQVQAAMPGLYKMLFGRTTEDTKNLKYPLMGANTVELEDDMLTVRGEIRRIVPGQFDTPKDSGFYGHAFYEASSVRKINGIYYFIYSSENSHELCYATSKYPDRDFVYGGTIISNGDVGYMGREGKNRLNMTGNNHGSLECVNGQWYVFYHRQTHNGTFSRQACAEPVTIAEDGSIAQAECTSCGLNGGPLKAEGNYPAACACNLTNGHMPHATNTMVHADIPYITHGDGERYITNIKAGTWIGFKYFEFTGPVRIAVRSKGTGYGKYILSAEESEAGRKLGEIAVAPTEEWKNFETAMELEEKSALYFRYEGSGMTELLEIMFLKTDKEPYRNPDFSVEDRVEDLIGRMTLKEKVCQLGCVYAYGGSLGNMAEELAFGIGQVGMSSGTTSLEENVNLVNSIQKYLLEETRLKIPALFHVETLNGGSLIGATTYPVPLGLASTWNPMQIEKMGGQIGQEMAAIGMKLALAPVMDVARDPRWGRMGETYGESPTLCAAMGTAYVKGIQEKRGKGAMAACAKHFLGYAASEGGLNMSGAHIGERELREVYAKPFEAAIRDGGLKAIMNCYLAVDGEPVTAAGKYLTDMLRGELGFSGLTIADYGAMEKLKDVFHLASDYAEAGAMALEAGLDTETPGRKCLDDAFVRKIEAGEIAEEIIDRPLRRVLSLKFSLGLFEHPYADLEMVKQAFCDETHRRTAYELACESMVLLKNENHLLPLKGLYKSIAVIGPCGEDERALFGGYTYVAFYEGMLKMLRGVADTMGLEGVEALKEQRVQLESRLSQMPSVEAVMKNSYGEILTITEAIRQAAKVCFPDIIVAYARGCSYLGEDRSGFEEAVRLAEKSDIVILLLGGKNGSGTGCTMGENVDSCRIGLPGVQEELARAVRETQKPVILVHLDGRPLSSMWAKENADAILEAWHPGQRGAQAIADTLFGVNTPGGKLPVTALRHSGQIPIYAEQNNGSGVLGRGKGNNEITQGYVDEPGFPLYPFGFGLSYTDFQIDNYKISAGAVAPDEKVFITCDVSNKGNLPGDEVVQLYFCDKLASVIRPVKELAGFQRVSLQPGEKKTIEFVFSVDQTAFVGRDGKWRIEAGEVELLIGNCSEQLEHAGDIRINSTKILEKSKRTFVSGSRIVQI